MQYDYYFNFKTTHENKQAGRRPWFYELFLCSFQCMDYHYEGIQPHSESSPLGSSKEVGLFQEVGFWGLGCYSNPRSLQNILA